MWHLGIPPSVPHQELGLGSEEFAGRSKSPSVPATHRARPIRPLVGHETKLVEEWTKADRIDGAIKARGPITEYLRINYLS